ncbi:hypothetical protein ACFXDH_33425 [Streptomyces sp. NPDC059467]|uniref:hypothetical protein n=1 Tax=Streptomyces sp. NPDC059467 TaxID=3346844 RepID=UPI003679E428
MLKIEIARPRKQRILIGFRSTRIRPIPVKPSCRSSPSTSTRPETQKFHRQQQSHRRPAGHQHRSQLQPRSHGDIRGQADGDTQQERSPSSPLGATPDTTLLLQQTHRGQQQQPVHRQRPQRRTHPIRRGPVMLPAFHYDYVPGILAAHLAVRQVGDAVRTVDIGCFATGSLRRGLSQGTRNTGRNGLTLPVPRRHGHRLIDRRPASNLRDFTVRGRRRTAFLLSGIEVLFPPQAFPQLDTVSVYNGWFPALSRPVQAVSAAAATAARHTFGRKLLELLTRPMGGQPGGPDAAERARTRSHIVAVASDAPDGVPLAEVHLEGPSIHTLTAELFAWAPTDSPSGTTSRPASSALSKPSASTRSGSAPPKSDCRSPVPRQRITAFLREGRGARMGVSSPIPSGPG